MKVSPGQMKDIIRLLIQEEKLEEQERKRKQEEKLREDAKKAAETKSQDAVEK